MNPVIGTFRAHWKLANLPQSFQILDTGDQLSAVKRVIKALNVDKPMKFECSTADAIASASKRTPIWVATDAIRVEKKRSGTTIATRRAASQGSFPNRSLAVW